MLKTITFVVLLFFSFAALGQVTKLPSFKQLSLPTSIKSMTPFLLVEKGKLWMSWVEKGKEKKELFVSTFDGKNWSNPSAVLSSNEIMANWADFPSLQRGGDGHLYVHWLRKSGGDGYFAEIAKSKNDGASWKHLGPLHADKNINAEHGFVSLVSDPGGVRAFWLDGREMSGHGKGQMQLRSAIVGEGVLSEQLVDPRVCSCCGTVATSINGSPHIFYRDRSEKEVRDISVAYPQAGQWTINPVSKDGWEIHGCPVNGPDISSEGGNVVLAWYSGGGGRAGVSVRFSSDGAKSFSKAIPIDGFLKGSLGRVQVLLTKKDEAIVFWMKSKEKGLADLYARRVNSMGAIGAPVVLTELGSSRSVGFPKTQKMGEMIYLAWTDSGQGEYVANGIRVGYFKEKEIPALGLKQKTKAISKSGFLSKGEYIPYLEGKTPSGKSEKLASFRGKVVLINYWASWCDACIEEFAHLNELRKKYKKHGFEIVAVNVDSKEDWEKAKALVKKASLTTGVWRDHENKGGEMFGYAALPFSLIVDSHQRIRWTKTGSLLGSGAVEKEIKRLLKIK